MKKEQMVELLTELLDCGYRDLDLLDSCEYDMYELTERVKEFSEEMKINDLVYAMFELAKNDCQASIEDRIDSLENEDLTEAEEKELEALRQIDFHDDIESFHNFIDTSIYLANHAEHKEELYLTYCKKELDMFEQKTGFNII